MDAERLQRIRRQLPHGAHVRSRRQNEQTSEVGCDRGSERVERLRQVQTAGSGFRGPEHGNIRIGRDLQNRHARGQNDQSRQKKGVGRNRGRRNKQEGAQPHGE